MRRRRDGLMDTLIIGNQLLPVRRAILQAMAGQGKLSIREVVRRVGRGVHAVHSDVRALHRSGGIDRTEDGGMILPYQVILVCFTFDTRQAARVPA